MNIKIIWRLMKQQDTYKILAAFLVITMLGSVFAYMFTGLSDNTDSDTEYPDTNLEKYNPDLWYSVNQPFYSISDALKMTPPGAVTVSFVDLEDMPPQMKLWAGSILPVNQVDSIYKSNTTKMYHANLQERENSSFLLLSTMLSPKNDFEYIVYPNTTIPILIRQEPDYSGIYNILGTPIIFAPPQTAIDVLDIIYSTNKSNTSYDQYEGLLTKVNPAPYQMITSNVSFARQFYDGIGLINGSYERTTAYLDANSSVLKKLNQLKANSTDKGFEQYSINLSGNYTIVKIVSPELFQVLSEETN
jgi:hypothetical protein